MSHRIFLGQRFDDPRREIDPAETVVFEFGNGATVKIYIDAAGEIRASSDDGMLVVKPQSSNVVTLVPFDRAAEVAARRVRKAIGAGSALMVPDVKTLVEAVLR